MNAQKYSEDFCFLARSKNAGVMGDYVKFWRQSRKVKRPLQIAQQCF
jgi:hypothetical protein